MNSRWLSAWMFALALLGGIAQAQVPQRINYQGYLGNASGQPINAPVQMVFKLYDVASGGTALWTETQASVAVTNGIFNVALGAVTPITLAFDQPYWLGVTVGTDAEMTPRQPLASNPYAMRAKQADGLAPSAPVAGSQVTGTIAGSQISGSLTNATLGGNTLAQVQGQFVAGLQPTSVAANVITTVDSTGLVGNYASLTIDMEGRPVIAYFDATKSDLKVAKCGNANCSAGNTVSIVDSTGNVGKYPSLVIGVDGLPVIAYYDATNSDLKVAKCRNDNCSAGNMISTVDSTGLVGEYPSLVMGVDGLPLIAYYDATNGDLKVAKCGNANCSAGNMISTVVSEGVVGEYSSLAIGVDGHPVIAYYDGTYGGLYVAWCWIANCSGGGNLTVVLDLPYMGHSPSLAIGVDGLPVIAYYDSGGDLTGTNGGLKVAKCRNVRCTGGSTLSNVDRTGIVGMYASLTIGIDGLPMIAYFDYSNGDVKVAKCGITDCSTGSTITVVDSTGVDSSTGVSQFVGQSSSLTIGIDGRPVIAYRDNTNVDLKVVKCANVFCAPYFRRR